MLRRWLFTTITLILTLGIPAARAADTNWTAWLRFGAHIIRVNAAGETLQTIDLPTSDAFPNFYSDDNGALVAISHNGRFAAYTLQSDTQTSVLIYDTQTDQIAVRYVHPAAADITSFLRPSSHLFNTDDTALAFTYALPNADGRTTDWGIKVLPITPDSPTESPEITISLTGNTGGMIVPMIWGFQDAEITYSYEIIMPDVGLTEANIWNTVTGDIAPSFVYNNLNAQTFDPTGEVIIPVNDLRLPRTDHYLNGFQVYDPIARNVYPFYAADVTAQQPTFVQNGERILLQDASGSMTHWRLIERDGTVISEWDLLPSIKIVSLHGTADGFVYTAAINCCDTLLTLPALFQVNTRDNELDPGYTAWYLDRPTYQEWEGANQGFEILWVNDPAPLGPFIPWAQLAEPVSAPMQPTPSVAVEPTAISTPEPLFHVGMTVRAQTTEGEILNLREAPSRDATILLYIEDDTPLLLLEGPLEAEGYIWWRVQTPDGTEGWAVENNGELQTLVPT